MIIQDTMINADCKQIVDELHRQLAINHIPYIHKVQDSGNNIMICCPYHSGGQERRPSMGIRKSDGICHCFSCGTVQTLPELISYCFSKDDMFGRWGMKWLVKNFSAVSIEEREDVEVNMERNNSTNKNNVLGNSVSNKPHTFVTEKELDKYRYYHPYWAERGITNDDIIELFDLGYDKDTDEITFPNVDVDGNCLFIARRSVKGKRFFYPKDVEKPLYGLHQLYQLDKRGVEKHGVPFMVNCNKLYITESMIDCLLLWQANRFAVALNGTGSEAQINTLKRIPIRHYVLATDNDKAGKLAREKLEKALPNKIITQIEFPDDVKDIGDLGRAKRFKDIELIDRWEVM